MDPNRANSQELKRLAEAGLLRREPAGNQVRYRANRDCPDYTELAGTVGDVVQVFVQIHESPSRKVNPVVMPTREFLNKHAIGDRFVTRRCRR
jgi:hypothetical protein